MAEQTPTFQPSQLKVPQNRDYSTLNSLQILSTSTLSDFFPLIQEPILKDLSDTNPYFRKIKSDGNSYYRAVYIAYLEMLIGLNDNGNALKSFLKKILNSEGYYFTSKKNTQYNQKFKPLLATYLFQLVTAVQKNPKDALILLAKMVIFSSEFDEAMIKTMKNLVQNLIESSWDLEINGKQITDYIDLKRYKNMNGFVEKAIKPMNVEAHEAILHVLPMALRITIVHKFVSPQRNQGKWQQVFPSDQDHTQKDGLNFHKKKIVLLFSNPSHFDLLYAQDYIDKNRLLIHAVDQFLEKTYPSKQEIKQKDQQVNGAEDVKFSEDPAEIDDKREQIEEKKEGNRPSQFSSKRNNTMPEIELNKVPPKTERHFSDNGSDTLRLKLKYMPFSQRLPSRSNVTTPSSVNQKIKPLKILESQGSQSLEHKKGSRSASRMERADSNFKISPKVQQQSQRIAPPQPRPRANNNNNQSWWDWFTSLFRIPQRRNATHVNFRAQYDYEESKAVFVRTHRCYSAWWFVAGLVAGILVERYFRFRSGYGRIGKYFLYQV